MANEPQALISQVALEKPIQVEIAPGATVAQVIDSAQIPEAAMPYIVTMLNGVEVTDWDGIWLEEDDQLAILVMPAGGGGKDILRLVAVIAVAVAAPYLAGAAGLTGTAATVATAGITLVGTMAVNALIPPADIRLTGGGSGSDPTFWFTGSSNQMKPYQNVPVVYGDVRMYAAAIASPVIFNTGTTSKFTGLFDFGLGNVVVEDIRLGDTSSSFLSGLHTQLVQEPKLIDDSDPSKGYKPVPLQLMNVPSASAPLSYGLNKKDDLGRATTRPDTQVARVEIGYPSGLVRFTDSGEEAKQSVSYKVEIKLASEDDTKWRAPTNMVGYAGGYLTLSNINQGDPDNPNNYPTGLITLDPHGLAPRDANNNIVLDMGDRLTVRLQFDRETYGIRPAKVMFNPTTTALTFDTSPVNPSGGYVVPSIDPAFGVIVISHSLSTTIVELEYTVTSAVQQTGIQPYIDTQGLFQDVGMTIPFDDNRLTSNEAFAVNSTGGALPVPPTTPGAPGGEVYQEGVTYFKYVEYEHDVMGTLVWLISIGSGEKWVNGSQVPIADTDIYTQRGTVVRREIGFSRRYTCYAAIKKEYL